MLRGYPEGISVSFNLDLFSDVPRNKIANMVAASTKMNTTYTSSYKPNDVKEGFRVCMNEVGGSKMSQLQSQFFNYAEAVNVMFKLFDVIYSCGYTTSKCVAEMRVVFDGDITKLTKLKDINTIRLVNAVDECCVDKRYSSEKHVSEYVGNLKYMRRKMSGAVPSGVGFHNEYSFPANRKTPLYVPDLESNVLTIRYNKNTNYQKEKRGASAFLSGVINATTSILGSNNKYSVAEMSKVNDVAVAQKRVADLAHSFDLFSVKFPNIEISVDLKQDEAVVKSRYNEFRGKLFDLVYFCGVEDCQVNYDSERGALQVKEAHIKNGMFVSDMEMFYCDISGDISGCVLVECNVSKSNIKDCELMYGCAINDSIIENTWFHGVGITVSNSFIRNPNDKLVEAELRNTKVAGVVNYGSIVDGGCEVFAVV